MSTNIMSLDVLWHEYDMLEQASKKLNYASVNDFVKAAALKVAKDTVTNDNITELRQTNLNMHNYLNMPNVLQQTTKCIHDSCPSCHGTGVKQDGSICIHHIACNCPKCSPR
jgi:uncharacterized protein (DUF1778 family)